MTAEFCVHEELATLPAKVRQAFESLLAVGQIDESVLELVLRAGRRAGDVSKLVGFAVGYLFMTAKGVPVADVIRMSEQLHRRINLSWSERRWRDEHSRLARVVTLQRLTADSVPYDLSRYQKHLPRQWPGYLVRSSRRLGMEGLRQRHCVASYHDQVQGNHCAIATVFLARQRWTVQIFLTKDPKRPLAIGQARTRNNRCASKAVSEALHDVLGIEYVRLTDSSTGAATERFYRENLRRVLPVLQELGTQEVCVSFDGSGDSGSIEDIAFHPELEGDPPLVSIRKPRRVYDEGSGSWLQSSEEEEAPLKVAIEELTYDYLDETDVDWYNNDGGYGDLIIDVTRGTVELTVNQRFIESTCQYSAEIDIASGEAL
jgi:hypothetical protein